MYNAQVMRAWEATDPAMTVGFLLGLIQEEQVISSTVIRHHDSRNSIRSRTRAPARRFRVSIMNSSIIHAELQESRTSSFRPDGTKYRFGFFQIVVVKMKVAPFSCPQSPSVVVETARRWSPIQIVPATEEWIGVIREVP